LNRGPHVAGLSFGKGEETTMRSIILDAGTVTLELKLESIDRKPLSKDLFEISGYAKQDFSGKGRKHKQGD
jgi:hypothetical protein